MFALDRKDYRIMPSVMELDASHSPEFDRISLREHFVETEVGAYNDERGRKQRLVFNIVAEVSATPAEDDVDLIPSYELLIEAIDDELATGRTDLLETLAGGICDRLLAHPRLLHVTVRIEKPDRVSGRFGIEIARSEARGPVAPVSPARPRVYCLPADAWLEDWFAGWVTALPGGAVALAVEGAPIEGDDISTRRIRFLLSEAAAWAMRDAIPGAEVVNSRTEMQDVFERGRCAIWAPSKMVFAARDPENGVLDDFARAVDWFAREMQALGLTYVNRAIPEDPAFNGAIDCWSPAR